MVSSTFFFLSSKWHGSVRKINVSGNEGDINDHTLRSVLYLFLTLFLRSYHHVVVACLACERAGVIVLAPPYIISTTVREGVLLFVRSTFG